MNVSGIDDIQCRNVVNLWNTVNVKRNYKECRIANGNGITLRQKKLNLLLRV
jgi:hypothetical protein